MSVKETLCALREEMCKNGIDACIVPGADPHLSEYFSSHWATVTHLSDFTGEAGTFALTQDMAGLWTDGRFYTQAGLQLDSSLVTLFRASEPDCPKPEQYLADTLPSGSVVGINGTLFSTKTVKAMKVILEKKGIQLNSHVDYANELWQDRPAQIVTEIYDLPVEYCGKSCADKLRELRQKLLEQEADSLVVSRLDNVAWLMNIRADDVPNNPVVTAYAYVSQQEARLYTDSSRLPQQVADILAKNGVSVHPYEAIFEELSAMGESQRLLCDESECSYNLYDAAAQNDKLSLVAGTDPIPLMKALKNEVETANTFKAYLYDGCAEAEFYAWLDEELAAGHEYNEWQLAEKLHQFRAQQPGFKDESFGTIMAYKENAAMMHYGPTAEENKLVKQQGLPLNDSGGQYHCGTTDTTPTVAVGPISDEERRDFTLVLRSVIDLSCACFLEGTSGKELDILARNNLWQLGINYRCGTGHGVGYLLNVHEGPQSFRSPLVLQEGMVLTVEPGVYTEGSHGVRTENTVVVRKGQKTEYGQFYYFETFTVVPIDSRCLDLSLLDERHIQWLNQYHKHVYETVAPHVSPRAKAWLERACAPVSR